MDYLDFELHVSRGEDARYPMDIIRSPAGIASGEMHFPFDPVALERQWRTFRAAARSVDLGAGQSTGGSPTDVEEFGRRLFQSLMVDSVLATYRQSQRSARSAGRGLRLRLRFDDPELAIVPWELMYDPAERDYVCLSSSTPMVRELDVDDDRRSLLVHPPLAVLGVIASPRDQPSLDVELERQRMEDATAGLQRAGQLRLEWVTGGTWRNLQVAMQRGPHHVLHFVGHGSFDTAQREGLMVFEDEAQQTMLCTATELARLLVDHFSLRLVVLNACLGAKADASDTLTSTSSVLVRRGVPAVVAMQHEIGDQAAVEFARSFYTALANWKPVDESVAEARKAVSFAMRDSIEWATPVLHMHSPDGVLFLPKKPPPPPPKPESVAYQLLSGADSCPTFEGAKVLLDRIDPGQFTDPDLVTCIVFSKTLVEFCLVAGVPRDASDRVSSFWAMMQAVNAPALIRHVWQEGFVKTLGIAYQIQKQINQYPDMMRRLSLKYGPGEVAGHLPGRSPTPMVRK